jgi:hypothetical protein
MRVRNYSPESPPLGAGLRKPPCFSRRNSYLQLTLFRFLVPGGGSALFELRINRAVTHDDLQTINGNHPVFRIPAAMPLIVKSVA